MSEQHIGERMKAVTVYELMLMKERRDELETQRDELLEALKAASEHLDYCGYGDSWERECAVEAGLEKQIAAAIEKAVS